MHHRKKRCEEGSAALGRILGLLTLALYPEASWAGVTEAGPMSPGEMTIHVAPHCPGAPAGDGSSVRPFRSLAAASAEAARRSADAPEGSGITLCLAPGHYMLEPGCATEPTCGNCADPDSPVDVTFGLRITGRGIRLLGAPDHGSVIHTGAGYGIWVQDCEDCALERLVVTGGIRDRSGEATCAAIVAQRTTLRIADCIVRDNIGDPDVLAATVAGIIGIAGREGSRLEIRNNRIVRNSWDGIALYRNAVAVIENNVIDGVDLALGTTAGGGRGVGIGVTWDARAEIRGNYIARYWKGIGIFVDARAIVEENVLEELATWGLSLWDAGIGSPVADFRRNAVCGTGACGAMLLRSDTGPPPAGSLTQNAFVRTGQNPRYDSGEPYCTQTAAAIHAVPPGFPIGDNSCFGNREPGGLPGSGDSHETEFLCRITPLCTALCQWSAAGESAFLEEFCRRSGYDRSVPAGGQRSPSCGHRWGRRLRRRGSGDRETHP